MESIDWFQAKAIVVNLGFIVFSFIYDENMFPISRDFVKTVQVYVISSSISVCIQLKQLLSHLKCYFWLS